MIRKLLFALTVTAAAGTPMGHAFAWSCVAGSSDGAQGWSNNYPSERKAERRALRECENVTTSYDCEVQQCVPDNGGS